jgi:type I restriction enzyme S subunit
MNNWQIKKLGEICKIVSGNTPKGIENISNTGNNQFYKVSDMNSFGNEVKMTRSNYNLTNEEIIKLKLKLYPKGTVIFPKRGGAILTNKKRVLSKDSTFDLNLMGVLPNENVNSSFLFYWFINLDLGKICDGSNIPQINNKNIAPLDFPLPPMETQQAIVSKIEELFSELDKGIEDLKTAQQQLKTYRQSVLKWAFEGKLTNENVKEGELPKGWEMVQIKDVASTYGGYAFKSGEFKSEGKYQVLRMGNVRPGIVRYDENPVFLDIVEQSVLNRSLLNIDDVIITQTGTRKKRDYGFTTLISKNNLLLNQRIASIRFNETYSPKFFLYYSWTDLFKDQFFANETGNVGQGNVGMKAVTETFIPNPTLNEQHFIVQEIESRLSVADKMEESIAQSLQQAEALRQSILKKAFSGELV